MGNPARAQRSKVKSEGKFTANSSAASASVAEAAFIYWATLLVASLCHV